MTAPKFTDWRPGHGSLSLLCVGLGPEQVRTVGLAVAWIVRS